MNDGNEIPFDLPFLEYLQTQVTPERLKRMKTVLASRTRYISIVLEDVFQAHNSSAVLRSCDALGIQDVHFIERNNSLKVNPEIALGSAQWLDLHRYRGQSADSALVARKLKEKGYRIVATSPRAEGWEIQNLPLDKGPVALMFGTELSGLSDEAMDLADEYVRIPMYGFVESFNISVSAAICLSQLSFKLRESDLDWRLTEDESNDVLFRWLLRSVSKPDLHYRQFRSLPAGGS